MTSTNADAMDAKEVEIIKRVHELGKVCGFGHCIALDDSGQLATFYNCWDHELIKFYKQVLAEGEVQ